MPLLAFINKFAMAKQNIFPREAKEKCSVGGFYSNHFDGINFRERVEPVKQCLPGHFIVERIISSRGTVKVSHTNKILIS